MKVKLFSRVRLIATPWTSAYQASPPMGFSSQEYWIGLPLPSPFFFWDPYNSNVGAFNIVPEVSETILSSFHSFYFILLFRSYFHHLIFQLMDSFLCFRYSAIDSFQIIFSFSNCVACHCILLFNSSRSLLIDSCIFSILFSRFLIIFTTIFLNYFSGSLPISSSFIWTSVFLVCSFICVVFVCLLIIYLFLMYCV